MKNGCGMVAMIAAVGLAGSPASAADPEPAARLSLAPQAGRAASPSGSKSHAGHGPASGAIINLGLIAAIGAGVLIATAGGKNSSADNADSN